MKKFKAKLIVKILIVLLSLFVVSVIALWLIGPGQLKKYIEEYDKEWINREVSIGEIDINPFTFKINVDNIQIKEPNSEINFLTLDNLLVNFDLWPLFKSKINTQEIKLTNLFGNIVQNGTHFNFSDLFKEEGKTTTETSENSFEFNLQNISVLNSRIDYTDKQLNSKIVLDSITIKDQFFKSSDSVFDANLVLHQPEGGWIKGDVLYNLVNNDYKINTQIKTWQLSPFKSYVTSVLQLSKFEGQLNADIQLAGSASTDFIESKGQITVLDFALVDPENKPLLSVGKLFVDVNEINSKTNIYDFQDILVDNSKINFEYLPNGDNFTKWLVNSPSIVTNDEVTDDYYISPFEMLSVYIYDMTKEYIFKSYTAKKIQFTNFNLKFYDYTLEDPFLMDLEEVAIRAEDIKPENQFANFNINGKINSTGIIGGDISVSRSGVENMKIDVSVKGLFLNRFSPYGRQYTAHRFMEGISSFSNKSEIKDSYLTSTNTLHIEKIKVGKKSKTKSGSSLPMRFVVALMKDSKGNIDLEIPVEGPINDPKYKFGKVIWQVIKNLFTKVVSSPVKALSSMFKVNEEDLSNVYFNNGQVGLSPNQKKSLNTIVKVLNKKPDLKISLNHLYNKEYEFDGLALKNVKVSYLNQSDIKKEGVPIGKQAAGLSTSDPDFLVYLRKTSPNYDETISIQENARRINGKEFLKEELEKVIAKQKELVKNYLIEEKQISESRFSINDHSTTEEALNQSRPKFEVKFSVEEE